MQLCDAAHNQGVPFECNAVHSELLQAGVCIPLFSCVELC